ncbi:MAG: Type 1 glutamine amidotransferase-like domain-containing protein [Lachnospiraceae bacterium]|nr:Type 1 glutamine amidotransferase-like domain-containing protein [Lachnospiraceae bacterium]
MIAYLSSHIGGSYKENGIRIPTQLIADNGFLESLQQHWKDNSDVLIISSDPDSSEMNDSIRDVFAEAFPMSGLSIRRMQICDKRNEEIAAQIADYDVLILAGGHVPTQNAFFQKIRLKERIKDFDGILIGISAGTMNCAETVYAQPELEGESIDKEYRRFLSGLGITRLMILPHFQYIRNNILDGKRIMEDITFPDSYGREFYGLTDGSYVMIENETMTLYGEAYLIRDGELTQICEKDRCVTISLN